MSVRRASAIRSFRRIQPASAAIQTFDQWLASTNGGAGPTRYWPMADVSGTAMAASIGGIPSTYLNPSDLQLNITDALGEKWVGFGATSPAPGYVTITTALQSSAFTALILLQPDLVKTKHVLLNSGADNAAGHFSVELIDDGAGGLKPRIFSCDGAGAVVAYVGTSPGTIPVGVPSALFYVRRAAGTQECWVIRAGQAVNVALTLQSGTPPVSWSAHPAGTWRQCVWPTLAAPFDGVMRGLALWPVALSGADIAALENISPFFQPVVHLRDFNAGAIEEGQTALIQLAGHAHPALGFTVSIMSPGSLGVASVNGESIEYAAGSTAGVDTFTARITKGGLNSRTATITIEVKDTVVSTTDLPYRGHGYGYAHHNQPHGNNRQRARAAAGGESFFFYAEKTGVVTGLQWHVRVGNGYSMPITAGLAAGSYGTYTLRIVAANPATRRPVSSPATICQLVGYQPTAPARPPANGGWDYPTINFTTTGQLIAGQPYCIQSIRTTTGNTFYSQNIAWSASGVAFPNDAHYSEPGRGNAGNANYVIEGPGNTIEPQNVGAVITRVRGWSPFVVGGVAQWPGHVATQDGVLHHRVGNPEIGLIYADGEISGWGSWGARVTRTIRSPATLEPSGWSESAARASRSAIASE